MLAFYVQIGEFELRGLTPAHSTCLNPSSMVAWEFLMPVHFSCHELRDQKSPSSPPSIPRFARNKKACPPSKQESFSRWICVDRTLQDSDSHPSWSKRFRQGIPFGFEIYQRPYPCWIRSEQNIDPLSIGHRRC